MLKSIYAFCLILVLTASLITAVPVSAASDSDIQLIVDLGIISVSENTGLIPTGFNRADFARSLCLMERNDNPPQITAEESVAYASDISTNSNRNFIVSVLSSDYMENDSEGKFNPSESISLRDAVTALVRMLGYETMVQANGGTYDAYYKIALKMGIMKGVSVANSEKLTSQEVAELLTNTMGAKMFLPDNIDYGEDCLWDRWNITVHLGKVLANSNMGILVERTDPGFINIDGNIYYTDLLIENSILGSEITYYTMPGDFGEDVVSISVKTYTDTITIQPDEIKSISENSKILTIKTEDKNEIKVDKKGFLIVNGKTQSPTRAMFDAFKSGTATLIDSDNNGVYDVVNMVILFQTIIEGVNPSNNTLATRFDNQVINLEDIDTYEIYLGKKKAKLSDLSAGMPVGIACDSFSIVEGKLVLNFTNAEYIRFYASNRTSTGYITALLDDGRFEIDDMSKSFGSGYTRLVAGGYIQPLKLGEYVTAYFDNLGELTYFEIAEGSGMRYGYLIKAAVAETLTKTTEVKILDAEGKFNIYAAGKRFVLDGSRVDSGSITYTVNTANDVDLSKRQLIRYRVEDGILKEIDTKVIRLSVESKENSLDESLPFDVTTTGNAKYTVRSGAINRKVAFSSDCIMFIDEADIDAVDPPDNRFTVSKASSLGNEDYYMAGYDSNTNGEVSCVVRYDGYGGANGDKRKGLGYHISNCYIVEEVLNARNADDEWGWRVTLAGDNKKVTHFAYEDNLKLYTTRSASDWGGEAVDVYREEPSNFTNVIKTGDIIRFQTNAAGNITYIEKMFDFASHKNSFAEVPSVGGQIYGFAKLEKICGNNFIYSYDTSGDVRFISRKADAFSTVPLYHVSTGEVEMVKFSELPSAATGNYVKCFLRYYNYGVVRDNIFYIYD